MEIRVSEKMVFWIFYDVSYFIYKIDTLNLTARPPRFEFV